MNLPSGLHDLLVISGLFSQANTAEAAAMVRKSCTETLNTIDKSYQYLGKILAIYLDEKAQIAGWFEPGGYWEQPLLENAILRSEPRAQYLMTGSIT
jgi:hypothetical protein